MTFSDRSAVITGGGRGIGAVVAEALLAGGARVVVAARTRSQLEKRVAAWTAEGHSAFAVECDVSDPHSVARMADQARERLGHVDMLVNNAGVGHSAPIRSLELADWQRVMSINATGTFLCTKAFLPQMVERGWGRVVNVASVASLTGAAYIAAYAASKHAMLGFTRCAAAEVAGQGVTVNAVCPGYVDTDMTTQSVARIARKTGRPFDQAMAKMLGAVGQSRLITCTEVAHVVLALCHPDASGTNGQAIVVDGGVLLR